MNGRSGSLIASLAGHRRSASESVAEVDQKDASSLTYALAAVAKRQRRSWMSDDLNGGLKEPNESTSEDSQFNGQ